jgi:hypothetical protein
MRAQEKINLTIRIHKEMRAGCQWPTLIILVIQETEIRRIMVQSQPRQTVHKTLCQNKSQKRAGGVAQVIRALA